MASLAEREKLRGKVQMIYIDPPYGIKFGSNWQVSARNRDVKDGKLEDAAREAEQIKAFRDTWELGIHSYLVVPARPADRRARSADRVGIVLRADRRRERSSRPRADGRGVRCRELRQRRSPSRRPRRWQSPADDVLAAVDDYIVWYAKDRRAREVPAALSSARTRRRRRRQYTRSSCRTARRRRAHAGRDATDRAACRRGATLTSPDNIDVGQGDGRSRSPSSSTARRSRPARRHWKTNARRAWSGLASRAG